MNFLTKTKRYFYNRQLTKSLSMQNRIVRKSTNFNSCQHIGILFDANNSEIVDAVLHYAEQLEQKGKKISLLGFVKIKEEVKDSAYPYFNLKNIRFDYLPKGKPVNEFINQQFDLLINCFFEENLSLEYISTVSKSRFRIGIHTDKHHCFDLMIATNGKEKKASFLFKQMERILGKMNKPAYESSTI